MSNLLFRCAITKATGSGEQIVLDMPSWNPVTGDIVCPDVATMSETLNQLLAFADFRLEEMNIRMLESYELLKCLPPEYQFRFRELLDVLYGKMSAQTLTSRWQAIKEENEELAKNRLEAQLAEAKLMASAGESLI